jgi:hypothetical protein
MKAYVIPMLPSVIKDMIPVRFELRNCDIQVLMASFGFVQETVRKITIVACRHGINSIVDLFPFLALLVCTFLVGLYQVDIWIGMPRTTLHLISGLFVEMCTQLMLNHMTAEKFQPLRCVLLPMVIFTGLVVSEYITESSTQTDDFLTIYTTVLWSFLLFKMTLIIHEACVVLNIWCFDITTPRQLDRMNDQKQK